MTEDEISHKVIGAAIELHRCLGPGLLESTYEHALAFDLREIGSSIEQQVPVPLIYKEVKLDCGYRIDLVVEKKVIIELKSIDVLAPVHYAQTLTYLRLCDLRLGLLMNFNTVLLKNAIHRIVNKL